MSLGLKSRRTDRVRILIGTDDRMLARALALRLTARDEFDVVGFAHTHGGTERLLADLEPDLLVLDGRLTDDVVVRRDSPLLVVRPGMSRKVVAYIERSDALALGDVIVSLCAPQDGLAHAASAFG